MCQLSCTLLANVSLSLWLVFLIMEPINPIPVDITGNCVAGNLSCAISLDFTTYLITILLFEIIYNKFRFLFLQLEEVCS